MQSKPEEVYKKLTKAGPRQPNRYVGFWSFALLSTLHRSCHSMNVLSNTTLAD